MNDKIHTISDAAALIKSRQFDQAMNLLKIFLQNEPRHELATGMLASVYAEIDMHEKALELYSRVLEINSDNILARFHLGLIHYNAGNYENAVEIWKPAADDPADFMIKYYLGLSCLKTNERSAGINLLVAASGLMPEEHPLYGELIRQLDAAKKFN